MTTQHEPEPVLSIYEYYIQQCKPTIRNFFYEENVNLTMLYIVKQNSSLGTVGMCIVHMALQVASTSLLYINKVVDLSLQNCGHFIWGLISKAKNKFSKGTQ